MATQQLSSRSLLSRINRKMASRGEQIQQSSKPGRAIGNFYRVSAGRVVQMRVDLARVAKQLGIGGS